MRILKFRNWLPLLLLAGIMVELGFLYKDTLMWMKTAWFGYTPDRAGIFVPPLFAWMAYARLKRHPKTATGSPFSGLVIILFSLLMFLLARAVEINFVQALSLIGIFFGIIVFFGGLPLGGAFLFPFAFLLLMIPSVSYLIESAVGLFLREMVLRGSYLLLHVTEEAWRMHPVGLQYGDAFVRIGFLRSGPSSLLFLLIIHFALTEWFFKKERRKFFFMIHFPLYFAVTFIFYYTLYGWATAAENVRLHGIFVSMEGWMPALIFIFIIGSVLFLAGRAERKRKHSIKGGEIAWKQSAN